MTDFPEWTTITREPDTTPRYGGAPRSTVFQPPIEQPPTRTVYVGMGLACTLSDSDVAPEDVYYERDFAAEAKAARESIMYPEGLRDREHGR